MQFNVYAIQRLCDSTLRTISQYDRSLKFPAYTTLGEPSLPSIFRVHPQFAFRARWTPPHYTASDSDGGDTPTGAGAATGGRMSLVMREQVATIIMRIRGEAYSWGSK